MHTSRSRLEDHLNELYAIIGRLRDERAMCVCGMGDGGEDVNVHPIALPERSGHLRLLRASAIPGFLVFSMVVHPGQLLDHLLRLMT